MMRYFSLESEAWKACSRAGELAVHGLGYAEVLLDGADLFGGVAEGHAGGEVER